MDRLDGMRLFVRVAELGSFAAVAQQMNVARSVVTRQIAALETHLRKHVLAPHVPVKWLFCNELPRTPSLKTDRPAVKRLFNGN